MDAMSLRHAPTLSWLLTIAALLAVATVGSLVVRELRAVSPAATAVAAGFPEVPAGVPAGALAVPVLLLPDGHEVRPGDTVARVAMRLGRHAEVGTQVSGRGPDRGRLTRFYEHARMRFVLVFEPRAGDGELHVTGIYIQ